MNNDELIFLLEHGIPIKPDWFDDNVILCDDMIDVAITLDYGFKPVLFIDESTITGKSGRAIIQYEGV